MAKQTRFTIHDVILLTRWLTRAGSVVLIFLVLRGALDVLNDLGGLGQLEVLIILVVAGLLAVAGYLLETAPITRPERDADPGE